MSQKLHGSATSTRRPSCNSNVVSGEIEIAGHRFTGQRLLVFRRGDRRHGSKSSPLTSVISACYFLMTNCKPRCRAASAPPRIERIANCEVGRRSGRRRDCDG